MLRTALRPRMLGLLALMVAATLVCGLLASWQWDRAHRALTSRDDGPVSLGQVQDVLEVGGAVTNDMVGNLVDATGTFDPAQQLLVPGRRIDGADATIVISALHLDLPDGSTAHLPVARGWLPTAEVTGADGELDPSLAPPPPTGQVQITGRIEASEAASDGIRDGIASEIATPLLVNEWGGPMYAGYVAQTSQAEGLAPMPTAQSAFTRGLDWQNIGYAAQWILFGAFFLYLWWRSVRTAYLDELADRREDLQREIDASTGTGGGLPTPDESLPAADTAAASPSSTPHPSTAPKDV